MAAKPSILTAKFFCSRRSACLSASRCARCAASSSSLAPAACRFLSAVVCLLSCASMQKSTLNSVYAVHAVLPVVQGLWHSLLPCRTEDCTQHMLCMLCCQLTLSVPPAVKKNHYKASVADAVKQRRMIRPALSLQLSSLPLLLLCDCSLLNFQPLLQLSPCLCFPLLKLPLLCILDGA